MGKSPSRRHLVSEDQVKDFRFLADRTIAVTISLVPMSIDLDSIFEKKSQLVSIFAQRWSVMLNTLGGPGATRDCQVTQLLAQLLCLPPCVGCLF